MRGFGKVWSSEPQVRQKLGWARGPERQVDGAWEHFENGWLISTSEYRSNPTFALLSPQSMRVFEVSPLPLPRWMYTHVPY